MISRRQILGDGRRRAGVVRVESPPPERKGLHGRQAVPTACRATPPRMGGTPTAFALRSRAARESGETVRHRRALSRHRPGRSADESSIDRSGDDQRDSGSGSKAADMHLICDPRLPTQEERCWRPLKLR